MGFSQVDIRVCFKTAWTCGDSPDSRGPGPEPTPPPPGVSLSSPQPCGGPAALVKLNRHKGLETADGPGHSPAHRHCPASTLTLARREAQPLLPDLGSQGPSASPENQRAKTTPWEVRPLADTGATRSSHWGVPEPHRGQHGASSPRANWGRPPTPPGLVRASRSRGGHREVAASAGRQAGSAGDASLPAGRTLVRAVGPAAAQGGAARTPEPARCPAPHRLPQRESRFCTAGTVEPAFWPVTRWRSSTTCTASGSLAAGGPGTQASGRATRGMAPRPTPALRRELQASRPGPQSHRPPRAVGLGSRRPARPAASPPASTGPAHH